MRGVCHSFLAVVLLLLCGMASASARVLTSPARSYTPAHQIEFAAYPADANSLPPNPHIGLFVSNNPVNLIDPTGEFAIVLAPAVPWLGSAAVSGLAALGLWELGETLADMVNQSSNEECDEVDPLDDFPANPDDWTPPEGWEETSAGGNTGGKHRQWNGPDGRQRRWDREGRPGGKDRGPHWHDSDRPGKHIPPTR